MRVKRSVPAELWDQQKECSRGKDHTAHELNMTLQAMRAKLVNIYHELQLQGKPITVQTICERFSGNSRKTHSLISVYEDHNKKFRSLVGIDYSKSTADKFDTSLLRLKEFIRHQYGKEDFELSDVDGMFVRNFELFLKTQTRCQNNTAVKHLKNLKKIIRIALSNDWISKDPFQRYAE